MWSIVRSQERSSEFPLNFLNTFQRENLMITKLFNSNLSGIIFVFCTHFHIRISTLVGFFLENYSVSQSSLLYSVCLTHDSSIKKNNDSTRALLSLTYHRRPINPMSYNRIVYIFVSSQKRLTMDWDFLTGRPFRQCSDLHVSWGRQGGPIPTTRVWGQVILVGDHGYHD
jgi:hypothetical protein